MCRERRLGLDLGVCQRLGPRLGVGPALRLRLRMQLCLRVQ